MTTNEKSAAVIHNLMNHGYSEEKARDLMQLMAGMLLSLPPEMLEDLGKAYGEDTSDGEQTD